MTRQEAAISERILKEIRDRLRFLLDVGMDYLSLERASGTLSGGEWQRIRLATQIGSGLSGVLYVLDEPTIGLHPRDNGRLIATLARLKEMGNTVLVVEHDADMMMASDGIIDMGPGAGLEGGHVVFQGTPSEILASETSLTGRYLSGRLGIPVPEKRRAPTGRFIVLEGATENNLKGIDIRIPVGVLTCVTGVSGSGKSTMVLETLYRVLARRLYRYKGRVGKIRNVRDLGDIEQGHRHGSAAHRPHAPLQSRHLHRCLRPSSGTSSPSCRNRERGATSPGGSASTSRAGAARPARATVSIKIEMHFLPDVYVTCDVCSGKRFNRETLEIQLQGQDHRRRPRHDGATRRSSFFENIPTIRHAAHALHDVGLGYITLGQSSTTLSGGEAQRIKLARELGKPLTGQRPSTSSTSPRPACTSTTSSKLLDVLRRLVDLGNTVVVIEHNLDVIKTADWIIDLGPEGGPGGGQIVAAGTPEDVARTEESLTGKFLKKVLP